MKELGACSVLAVSACCFLFWLSPPKAYASTVNMDFVGNPQGNVSGGAETYPYAFKINGGSQISLLCVSYQDTVKAGETWVANVYAIGTSQTLTGLTVTQQEEDAYLDSVILTSGASATTITDAQWADWALGDPSLFAPPTPANAFTGPYNFTSMTNELTTLGLNKVNGNNNDIAGIESQYENAYKFVATNTLTSDAKFYNAYQLYIPVSGTQTKGDGTPQSYMGPIVPEPSSFILFGSGLLTTAGALYRRRRRSA